ncbi:MAG TPA: hypothetical protein VN673_13755 [Clostridia bacterium]|nr:hypothetical protein [Clostridia bacterium]
MLELSIQDEQDATPLWELLGGSPIHTDAQGYKALAYEKLTPVLTEAIKEQQAQNQSQQEEIEVLKKGVTHSVALRTTGGAWTRNGGEERR